MEGSWELLSGEKEVFSDCSFPFCKKERSLVGLWRSGEGGTKEML